MSTKMFAHMLTFEKDAGEALLAISLRLTMWDLMLSKDSLLHVDSTNCYETDGT